MKLKSSFAGIKLTDFMIVVILVLMVLLVGYYYANNQARNQLWLSTYPIRAKLSLTNLSCSANSPSWMAEVLRYQTQQGDAPSNQIAYIDAQGQTHHCHNGYVDKYPLISQAVTADTRYRYASVTKLWTADAILSLVRQGKLTLDTPLVSILTQIDQPKDARVNDITIRQLLLHQGGFDRYGMFANDMFGIGEDICPNHIDKMNDIKLNFDPGSQSSYSNLGYCLLGEVVATLNQQPHQAPSYQDSIIKQYQLNQTHLRFISNAAMEDEVFYNHVETGITGLGDIYTAFDYDGLASAAGLSGNAIDLAEQVKAMIAQPEPNVLSMGDNHACEAIKTNSYQPHDSHSNSNNNNSDGNSHHGDDDKCHGYGTVAFRHAPNGSIMYYRDGALPGLRTSVIITQHGEIVALLSNGRGKEDGSQQLIKKIVKNLE